jgi:hypothetical protein
MLSREYDARARGGDAGSDKVDAVGAVGYKAEESGCGSS